MGYNIGVRLIEDFLAKSNTGTCTSFRETAEVISKVGFKVFMNVTPVVSGWSQDGKSFGLVFEENPLADFVELPDDGRAQEELWYSNVLCGLALGGWGEGEREAQGSTGSEAHRVVGIRNSAHPGARDSLWSGQSINILICAGPPVSPHGV